MPHQKREFIIGEYYHITLRRIGCEKMFIDESDYFRGIFSLFEFNNNNSVSIQQKRRKRISKKCVKGSPSNISGVELNLNEQELKICNNNQKKEKVLKIGVFCIMPNHIHLLVTPLMEGGITKFISKFASGYPAYFKERHGLEKTGHFFSDRFHAVHIKTDSQLRAVFTYIHTNPVSLIYPKWKEGAKIDAKKAFDFCKEYRWSSLKDYLGEKNFPSVTDRDFMEGHFGNKKNIEKETKEWLKHKEEEFEKNKDIFIE